MSELEITHTENGVAIPRKKIKINKFLKNFFFKGIKRRPEFKGLAKQMKGIDSVTIIISKGKNLLRAIKDGEKPLDTPFTEEEIQKLVKGLNIKQETIDGCASIFVMLRFDTQMIIIRQNKLDGSKKDFEI